MQFSPNKKYFEPYGALYSLQGPMPRTPYPSQYFVHPISARPTFTPVAVHPRMQTLPMSGRHK